MAAFLGQLRLSAHAPSWRGSRKPSSAVETPLRVAKTPCFEPEPGAKPSPLPAPHISADKSHIPCKHWSSAHNLRSDKTPDSAGTRSNYIVSIKRGWASRAHASPPARPDSDAQNTPVQTLQRLASVPRRQRPEPALNARYCWRQQRPLGCRLIHFAHCDPLLQCGATPRHSSDSLSA